MSEQSRREFMSGTAKVGAAAVAATGLLGTSKTAWAGANDKVRVAVIGFKGRGREHIESWNKLDNVEIATLCDIDENLYEPALKNFFAERTDSKDPTKVIAAKPKPKACGSESSSCARAWTIPAPCSTRSRSGSTSRAPSSARAVTCVASSCSGKRLHKFGRSHQRQ